MKKTIKLLLILTIICAVFSFVACNSNNSYENPMESADSNTGNAPSQNYEFITDVEARKLIYTVSLDITVTDMAKSGEEIVDKVKELGGWIQNSSESNYGSYLRYEYQLRVPTNKLDIFLSDVEGKGDVTNKNITSEDITTLYVSAEARKEALEQEKIALNSLELDTTTEIFARSKRISEINAELGALQLEINSYDSLVNYSKVTISLAKVTEEAPKLSFGKRLGKIFKSSIASVGTVFKAIFIGIVAAIPYLLIIGVVLLAVFVTRYLSNKNKCNDDDKDSNENNIDDDKTK